MILQNWLKQATKSLEAAGVSTPRLDGLLLLSHVLNQPKSWLLAHPEKPLRANDIRSLDAYLKRRINREPLAYITNQREFYGRNFYVDKRVMIPRPETENLVTYVVENAPQNSTALEVGTGSGAIALTVAKERSDMPLTAVDNSRDALAVAKKNKEILQAPSVQFKISNLLDSITKEFDLLVANLPYIGTEKAVNEEAEFEPPEALFADADGTAVYERLFAQLKTKPGFKTVVLEAEPFQKPALKKFAQGADYNLQLQKALLYVFERNV